MRSLLFVLLFLYSCSNVQKEAVVESFSSTQKETKVKRKTRKK